MPIRPDFDLQAHSLCSDGTLEPAAVVARAYAAGVRLLALTDHDTVEGVAEAIEAGACCGVRVVSGVEISAVHDANEDLHVLGYGIDHQSARLAERLAAFREDRSARAAAMAEALIGAGWAVDEDALAGVRAAGRPVGRPHLAAAVASHPTNARRLADEGLEDSSAVLVAYLLPGCETYRARTVPRVTEAIAVIHDAGGVAVWAHPFWDVDGVEEVSSLIEQFHRDGLDGVEAFYPSHSASQARALAGCCEELGMLCTGSSDFHGPEHRLFSRFRAFELHGCRAVLGPLA